MPSRPPNGGGIRVVPGAHALFVIQRSGLITSVRLVGDYDCQFSRKDLLGGMVWRYVRDPVGLAAVLRNVLLTGSPATLRVTLDAPGDIRRIARISPLFDYDGSCSDSVLARVYAEDWQKKEPL